MCLLEERMRLQSLVGSCQTPDGGHLGYEVRLIRRLKTECRKKRLQPRGTGEAIPGTQELGQGSQALRAVCLELADRDGILPSTPAAPTP